MDLGIDKANDYQTAPGGDSQETKSPVVEATMNPYKQSLLLARAGRKTTMLRSSAALSMLTIRPAEVNRSRNLYP
jgi:hypothetical protein